MAITSAELDPDRPPIVEWNDVHKCWRTVIYLRPIADRATCDTCKHWGPNIAKTASRPIGACYAPKMQCGTNAIIDDPTAAGLDDCWSAVNAPPIVLLTGPKFGCVHHEGRD